MFVLQNVIWPSPDTVGDSRMFSRSRENGRVCYDGYFNIFSLSKWKRYTDIPDLFLTLKAQGSGRVEIWLGQEMIAAGAVSEAAGEISVDISSCLKADGSEEPEIIWFSFLPDDENSRVINAAFATHGSPRRTVRLAGDICTFKREKEVLENIRLICRHHMDDPQSPLYGKLELFVVDNAGTLDEGQIPKTGPGPCRVHLFSNKNAGGSGGFTRGLMEIQKRGEDLTHVIFMDDDARPHPEAFVRTFALLSFIRDEYESCCVSGAVLDADVRHIQNESGALLERERPVALGKDMDLCLWENVVKNERIYGSDYGGWWYCCYPLKVASPDNLPFPFFIHVDDMEYGMRNDNGIILLNGICCWHESFDKRQTQSMIYYELRNHMVANGLRDDGWDLKHVLGLCRETILVGSLRYLYSSADLVRMAVEDYLAGPEKFGCIDPVEKHARVGKMAVSLLPFKELTDDPQLIEKMEAYCDRIRDGKRSRPPIGKRKYILTFNGNLLPAKRAVSKAETPLYSFCEEDMRVLYRAPRGILIDPFSRRGAWIQRSFGSLVRCGMTYLKVRKMLRRDHDRVRAQYNEKWRSLTSTGFWEGYLGIKQ